jgi:type II secretion system protein C
VIDKDERSLAARGSFTRYRAIAVAVAIGFGAFAAHQFWPEDQPFSAEKRQDRPSLSTVPPPPVPVAPVLSDPELAPVGTDASVSKQPVRLVLASTVPGRNAREGRAMLGTDVRNAQTYMAGAILANGAKLAEIYHDCVVLEKDGKTALLYVDGAGRQADHGIEALAMVGGATPPVKPLQIAIDPITDYMRTVPVYRNDTIVGFQVYPGARAAAFNAWGFRPGDVITEIDGTALTDSAQAMEILGALSMGSALTARVRRSDGATLTLTLDGAALKPAT